MSKYVMGNHVRVTDPSHHDFDQVGEVVDVIRELNRWLYSVRFGIAYVPIPECHLILADQPAAAPAPFAFTFNVEGTAASQGSKKAFIVGGKVNLVEMSKNLPAWRALVTRAAMRAWNRPTEYDESVAIDLMGTRIGLVHGNQFGAGQAVTWWEKQTFGAQAATTADILIFGHYHSFSAAVAGRNPKNDRQRWCLGAPTLDNGSDWFRTVAGRESDPGLLVFDVTEDGFDLSSLTIISAGENIALAA